MYITPLVGLYLLRTKPYIFKRVLKKYFLFTDIYELHKTYLRGWPKFLGETIARYFMLWTRIKGHGNRQSKQSVLDSSCLVIRMKRIPENSLKITNKHTSSLGWLGNTRGATYLGLGS